MRNTLYLRGGRCASPFNPLAASRGDKKSGETGQQGGQKGIAPSVPEMLEFNKVTPPFPLLQKRGSRREKESRRDAAAPFLPFDRMFGRLFVANLGHFESELVNV